MKLGWGYIREADRVFKNLVKLAPRITAGIVVLPSHTESTHGSREKNTSDALTLPPTWITS